MPWAFKKDISPSGGAISSVDSSLPPCHSLFTHIHPMDIASWAPYCVVNSCGPVVMDMVLGLSEITRLQSESPHAVDHILEQYRGVHSRMLTHSRFLQSQLDTARSQTAPTWILRSEEELLTSLNAIAVLSLFFGKASVRPTRSQLTRSGLHD